MDHYPHDKATSQAMDAPSGAVPFAAQPLPRRDRRRRGQSSGVALVRTTIPTCLVFSILMPLLGIAWFLLPGGSPLKVNGPGLALGLIGLGALCAVAAWVLMRHVSRSVAPPTVPGPAQR